jgi:uncharacterized membrane protein YgcG
VTFRYRFDVSNKAYLLVMLAARATCAAHCKRQSPVADPKLRHGPKGQDVQFFRFSEKVMRNKVLKAHLWMYLRGTTYQQGSKTSHEGQADAPAPESPGGGYDGGGGGGGGGDGGWSVPLVIMST